MRNMVRMETDQLSTCIRIFLFVLLVASISYTMYLANPTEQLGVDFIANTFHQKMGK